MTVSRPIVPAIMIGGSGSRLWPLSRSNRPKQFLNLGGDGTMFEDTLRRFDAPSFAPAWLLGGAETFGHARAQAAGTGLPVSGMVIEPEMRGTAAAIATIALVLADEDPETLVLVAPADHFISDAAAFRAAANEGALLAAEGAIVTFGMEPTGPETGFGYIAPGAAIEAAGAVRGFRIAAGGFREKPDLETARQFVADGCLWNGGIFLFTAATMVRELETHAPATLAAALEALAEAKVTANGHKTIAPDAAAYARAPLELSIDVAVMETTDRAVVVPCRGIGWSDVGSLSALWEIAPRDADGNAIVGDALLHEARNVYVHSAAGRKTVAAHVSDLLIVDTEDALIVIPTDRAQSVKAIVKALKAGNAPELRYAGSDAGLQETAE